jgi:hypothetical protein
VSFQKINTVLWEVNYTYAGGGDPDYPDADWQQLWFNNWNAPRSMTIGSETKNLTQAGLLEVLWANDFLSFSAGSTTSFLVDTYRVDVTPLAVARAGAVFPSGPPWVQPSRDVTAQFDVTLVPEPVTMAGLALGIGSLATYVRKRRTA